MFQWAKAILLLGCVATPTLAQEAKQSDSPSQAHSSQSNSIAPAGQAAAAPSSHTYPLDAFGDFSAVMFGSRAEPGEGASHGHIYRAGNRMRMEEPGGHAYFITDLTTGETFGIAEAGCIHDDHPYIRAIPFYIAGRADATVTRAPAGKETVDGHSCLIEDLAVSSPMLPNPQTMRLWQAEDLQGFPVKIEFLLPHGHGPVIRFKNVVLGPQDPTLFLHPKSCQPLPQQSKSSPAH